MLSVRNFDHLFISVLKEKMSIELFRGFDNEVLYDADEIIIHDNYYPETRINDIGLIKLKKKIHIVPGEKEIIQVTLRNKGKYDRSILAGWGCTHFEVNLFLHSSLVTKNFSTVCVHYSPIRE